MKTERKILFTFILNLAFSLFEFVGGIFTGSIAIISDAIHDMGDATSIGVSFFLEKKSKRRPDKKYTYGYARFSVLGSLITTLVLILGSSIVVYNAIDRIITPIVIKSDLMIIFAVVGVCVNLFATILTHKGESLNQKAVNLHMLEDVLGWGVVLVGSIIMRVTGFTLLDSIMSIIIAVFIFVMAIKNLKQTLQIFLEKVPDGICLNEIEEHLCKLTDVIEVHHVHVWSMDGQNNYATMHVVTDSDAQIIKEKIREELKEFNINHVTLEFEKTGEDCKDKSCPGCLTQSISHNHLHHHH